MGFPTGVLSPTLALIWVYRCGASSAEVGSVLAIYDGSGFIASTAARLRRQEAGLLAAHAGLRCPHRCAGDRPVAGHHPARRHRHLDLLGGPAGVSSSLLFAHLRHDGARPADIVNARAIVSVAWVAGPPLATLIIGSFGNRAILAAIGAVEVPALILIGRLSTRHSHLGLLATGCVAGIAYYIGLAFVAEPFLLIVLQVLNPWSFAGISSIGLPLFQQMLPRPGLSTGLYLNTRRIGSIIPGPIIAVGSLTALGPHGIFLSSAVITVIGLGIVALAARNSRSTRPT